MAEWVEWISMEDAEKISGFYLKLRGNATLPDNPLRFIRAIEYRIYTEWCCNKNESGEGRNHKNYSGEAYEKFVNDEKQFASQRGMRFETDQEARDVTLKALTRRSIDYFGLYGMNGDMRKDGENLRTSLKHWF